MAKRADEITYGKVSKKELEPTGTKEGGRLYLWTKSGRRQEKHTTGDNGEKEVGVYVGDSQGRGVTGWVPNAKRKRGALLNPFGQ